MTILAKTKQITFSLWSVTQRAIPFFCPLDRAILELYNEKQPLRSSIENTALENKRLELGVVLSGIPELGGGGKNSAVCTLEASQGKLSSRPALAK